MGTKSSSLYTRKTKNKISSLKKSTRNNNSKTKILKFKKISNFKIQPLARGQPSSFKKIIDVEGGS